MNMIIPSETRRRCNDNALHCFGTAYMFEKHAKSIRRKITFLTFLGIAAPATVGAFIGTFNLSPNVTKFVLVLAGLISILQLIFSIWALASGWNDHLSYYLESKSANYRLADEYTQLANIISISQTEFDTKLQVLETEGKLRNDLDNRHDITDKEKRMGMRAGLRQYRRLCAGCSTMPSSMKPTNCGVCGK